MKLKTLSIAFLNLLAGALLLAQSVRADSLATWTLQTNGLTNNGYYFNAVAYGNGLFVAVGPCIATSPNGTNWTVVPGAAHQYLNTPLSPGGPDGPGPLTSVIYADGMFVAVGPSVAVTSTDGVNWVNNTQVPWVTVGLNSQGIAYGGGLFAVYFTVPANSLDDAVSISTDGLHWTGSPTANHNYYIPTMNDQVVGLVWNGSQFVFVSDSGYIETVTPAQLQQLATSADWPALNTSGPSAYPSGWEALTFASGTYYLGGGPSTGVGISSGGLAAWRPDSGSAQYSDWWTAIASGNGQLVATTGSVIVSATPGSSPSWQTEWSLPPSPASYITGLVNGNGLWVAVGESDSGFGPPLVWTSGGFVRLKLVSPLNGLVIRSILPAGVVSSITNLVAVGDNGVIFTVNGTNFSPQISPTTDQLRGLGSGLSHLVAVGAGGTILDSTDGTDWTATPSPTTKLLYGVASGNGLDVAVGAAGTVLTSLDDMNWISAPALGTNDLVSITFGNGQFEALSSTGNIFLSADGSTWTADALTLPGTVGQLASLSFAGGQFTGTDTNGDVLTSSDGIAYDLLLTGTSATAGIAGASLVNGSLVTVGSGGISTAQFPVAGTGTTENLYGVAYSGALYVAVGESGAIIESLDGGAWTAPTNYFGTPNALNGVTYGNGLFVGAGAGGWIVTSSDGNNWTSTSSGATTATLNAIAYGAGKFVAVGDGGTIITSSGGVNWTVASSGETTTLEGIAFANGLFVVSDSGGNTLTSTDGVHWTSGGNSLDGDLTGVAAGNGVFVIVDQSGEVFSSTDGKTWVQRAGAQFGLFGVTYGGGNFVATGINGALLVSPNGTNWIQQQTTTSEYLYGVVFGNSQFILVGNGGVSLSESQGALASLPSATTWNLVNFPTASTLTSVASNGRLDVVVSSDSASDAVSTNGATWSVQGNGLEQAGSEVTWGNGLFVEVDLNGGIYTSPDGTNWTQQASVGVGLSAVAYGGGVYVATAPAGEVLTSSDSIHWSPHHTGLVGDLAALTYASGQFVVVSGDDTVATSANGTTWTPQTTPALGFLTAITYANGLYVAVGESGTIITSPDGIHWALQTTPPITFGTLYAIAWGNNEFMAVGAGGWTIRSGDGTNWISSSSGTVNDLYSIIFAHGQFLTVGTYGTILETPPILPSQLESIALMPGHGVQITLQGTMNSRYAIQSSTDLLNWTTLTGVSLNGTNSGQFMDSAAMSPNQPHRYYRAVVAP